MDETSLPPLISADVMFGTEIHSPQAGFARLERIAVKDGTPLPVPIAVLTRIAFKGASPAFDLDIRLLLPDMTVNQGTIRAERAKDGSVSALSRYLLPLLGRYDVMVSLPGQGIVASATLHVE